MADRINAMFDAIDADKSGAIDPTELMMHLLGVGQEHESVSALFKVLDKDGDGLISREEFVAGFAKMDISANLAAVQTQVDASGAEATNIEDLNVAAALIQGAAAAAAGGAVMNTAFVFAKPHANTPAVLDVIKAKFGEKAINIVKEGDVTGEDIDSKGYIDQHYYAIAEKSTLTSGKDLPVDAAKFEGAFEEKWETVVAEGRAFNALEFSKNFAQFQEAGALDAAWDATSVDKKTRVKLGGGFYCGQIEVEGVKNYTFNAFFMTMRGKFTVRDTAEANLTLTLTLTLTLSLTLTTDPDQAPGTSIHYYVVEFDPTKLSCDPHGQNTRPAAKCPCGHAPLHRPARLLGAAPWARGGGPSPPGCRREAEAALVPAQSRRWHRLWPSRWADFRGSVLGPTDPKDAPEGALRGIIAAGWEALGLKAECNGGDNAVHASASPFEGLAERMNWLALAPADDVFGKVLLAAGIPEETIKKWSSDPQVTYDAETATKAGKEKGSIFDALEDLDYQACLDKCVAISKA